jgi:hypothetical protein
MPNIAKRKACSRDKNQKSPASGPGVKNQQQRSEQKKNKRIRSGIWERDGALTG